MEVGWVRGSGRSRGPACQVLCPWSDLHLPGAEEPRTRLSCGQQAEQGWHPPGWTSTLWKSWTLAFGQLPLLKVSFQWPWGPATPSLASASWPWDWMLGSALSRFLPSAPVSSSHMLVSLCLSLSSGDWFWLWLTDYHSYFLSSLPAQFPLVFSFSCLAIWHVFSSYRTWGVNPQDW